MLRVVVPPTNVDANGLSREGNLSPEAFDTTHAQCWCGLGSHGQASTSTSTRTSVHSCVVSTQLEFPWQGDEDDEPEAINHGQPVMLLPKNTNTSYTTGSHEHELHELRLIISGYRWVASSKMGTFWHEASDLNEKDIASFALLDTLTRWLPHWQGGTLHVRTNDVCVLRGIRGAYSHSGVWDAMRSLCGQYDVDLSAKVVERSSSGTLFARRGGNTRDGKCAAGTLCKALRNPDVVNAAVKWLMASGEQGSTVYRTMLSYLTV